MAPIHHNFEWDDDKAEANERKHGVSFYEAADILMDPDGDHFHIDDDDSAHADGEDRIRTMPSDPEDRSVVYIISWTDRSTDDEQITRIISARFADKKETKDYVNRFPG